MKCKVYFYISDDSDPLIFEIESDNNDFVHSEQWIKQDLFKAVKQDNEKLLFKAIYEEASKTGFRSIEVKDILKYIDKKDGATRILQPNASMGYLNELFGSTDIYFDTDSFIDDTGQHTARVMVVNNLRVGMSKIQGRIIRPDGQEIFVVSGRRNKNGVAEDIRKLAAYLRTRKAIKDEVVKLDKESDTYRKLNLVLLEVNKTSKRLDKPKTIEDLLLDYMNNRKTYYKININYNDKQYTALNVLFDALVDFNIISRKRSNFDDDMINDLVEQEIDNYDNPKKHKYYILYSSLRNIVSTYRPQWLSKLEIKSDKAFRSFFGKSFALLTEDEKKDFKEAFDLTDEDLTNLGSDENKDKKLWNFLIENIAEGDLNFRLVFSAEKDNTIELVEDFKSIEDRFEIAFDTDHKVIPNEKYRGYIIYSFSKGEGDLAKTYYFAVRGALEYASVNTYKTIDEVKAYVNKKIGYLNIWNNSFIEFHLLSGTNTVKQSNQFFNNGSIIEILNITLPTTGFFTQEERDFMLNHRFSDVEKYIDDIWQYSSTSFSRGKDAYTQVDTDKMKKVLDTPEKFALFLWIKNAVLKRAEETANEPNSEILFDKDTQNRIINAVVLIIENHTSEQQLSVPDNIKGLLPAPDDSKTNKYLYFYVDDVSNYQVDKNNKRRKYNYHLILTDFVKVDNYTCTGAHQKSDITKAMFTAITETLNSKFSVLSQLITSSDFDTIEELKGKNLDKTANAFILNGIVYINTDYASADDAFHEYVHLILSYMKNNKGLQKNYVSLMQIFGGMKDNNGMTYLDRARILKNGGYSDLSEMDLLEELFCRTFSRWVMNGHVNAQYNDFFDNALNKGMHGLFNINSNKDLKEIYKGSIGTIFSYFMDDIANLIKDNNFSTFGDTSMTRKKTKFISNQIKKGRIKEVCE